MMALQNRNNFKQDDCLAGTPSSSNASQAEWLGERSSSEAKTSNDDSPLVDFTCKICDVRTEETSCGITVCCACKKFFLRNQTQLRIFSCLTGRNDCDVSRVAKIGDALWPRKLKLICRRCRLAKAFAAGLSMKGSRRSLFRLGSDGASNFFPSRFADFAFGPQRECDKPSPIKQPIAAFARNISSSSSSSSGESDSAEPKSVENKKGCNQTPSTCNDVNFPFTSRQAAADSSQTASTSSDFPALCLTPKMLDEINAAAETYLNAAMTAFVEVAQKFAQIPFFPIDPSGSASTLWPVVASDFDATGRLFVDYVKKLPAGLTTCHQQAASSCDLSILQTAFAGLKAVAVSSPFARRSFVSCFERTRLGTGCPLPDIEVLDECVCLIESAIQMWRPSIGELAILMAVHTCQSLTDSQTLHSQQTRPSSTKEPIMLLYIALSSLSARVNSSQSNERMEMFKNLLGMLKVISARWNDTLSRLIQFCMFPLSVYDCNSPGAQTLQTPVTNDNGMTLNTGGFQLANFAENFRKYNNNNN